ncbi:uncharacterized protein LOC128712474 [Anopheles marshallii]|uniref:uncharacterized protein LOC128712474 n=1 Tax=Anopheles marshallii TaxID=1521116 RepID=UPI00237A7FBE|nr:uncharacterized protein LOC128712474 [Anopheles marshallii]
MVLAAIADFIYEFYSFLHSVVTFISYIGYLVYYIICKAAWVMQNVTIFARIVYEDNHHFIQDSKAFIVGTSDFFIANIGKVYNAVKFIGTAVYDGTVAAVSLLKLIVLSAKQSIVLFGDAVCLLITAPYQLLLFCYSLLCDVHLFFQNDGLFQMMRFISNELVVSAVIVVVLAVLIYQHADTEQVKLVYNFMKEKVRTGVEFMYKALETVLLARRARRVETVRDRTPTPSTVGICIICQENERTVAFIPCEHLCVCKVCARILIYYDPKCPLCRSYIYERLEVYV